MEKLSFKLVLGKYETNGVKLGIWLKSEQGRARERTLTEEEVVVAVNRLTSYLDNIGVCKKNRQGCVVRLDPNAQHFAKCYKGIPESTHLWVTFTQAGSPVISGLRRGRCKESGFDITFSESAKTDIILYASKGKM